MDKKVGSISMVLPFQLSAYIYINIIWQNFNYSDYYAVIAPFLMPGRSRYGIFKIRRKTFTVGIGFGLVLVEILDFERQLGID